MRYVCSKKYKVLCKEDCFHVKNMKEENKVWFDTIEEGLNYGCRPCKHCLKIIQYEAYKRHRFEILDMMLNTIENAPYRSTFGFATQEEEEQYNTELSQYLESVKPEILTRLKEFGFIINESEV